MMQMKTNGKMPPANVGPPDANVSLTVGQGSGGFAKQTPADLEEAGDVIARAEQHPDRQHRCDETVAAQGEDGRRFAEREDRLEGRFGNEGAESGGPKHSDRADQRCFHDAALADLVHPQADEEGDRDGAGDGEGAPRAAGDELDGTLRQDVCELER
jgi:hypothetical protein